MRAFQPSTRLPTPAAEFPPNDPVRPRSPCGPVQPAAPSLWGHLHVNNLRRWMLFAVASIWAAYPMMEPRAEGEGTKFGSVRYTTSRYYGHGGIDSNVIACVLLTCFTNGLIRASLTNWICERWQQTRCIFLSGILLNCIVLGFTCVDIHPSLHKYWEAPSVHGTPKLILGPL